VAFSVSTAKVDITPTLAQNPYMAGYGAQGDPRTAISSSAYSQPLLARCIIIWEGTAPHALVSVDVLAIPRSMHQSMRPRLIGLANWASADIVVQATHTHNGPALVDMLHLFTSYGLSDYTLVRSYSAWLENTIVDLVRTTLNAAKTSVTLDYKVTTAGIAWNRVGLATTETAVPILTARAADGSARAVIWSYGCHPISAGWQEEWDGDWPSGTCAHIEASNGFGFAMFLQGPAGDQDPRGNWSWTLRDSNSTTLGVAVTMAARTAGRALTGTLQTSLQEVNLPLDTSTSLTNARSQYVARLGNPDGQPAWYQRHAQVMVSRIDSGVVETSIPNPLAVWKLQGSPMLRIALTGGELVSAYGSYFRNLYGGTNGILIGGYANEVSCYIPDNQFLPGGAFTDGSYEGGWEPDHSGIAGGNLTVYPHLYHFSTSAPTTLINALTAQLA
jgi:neutral ceramidase